MSSLKYINLFSGIGGWELGLADLPMENVLSCEIDKYARQTFLANFAHLPCVKNGYYPEDVRTLDPAQMPDFDILIASFPCQSFSMIGHRLGLQDTKDDKGSMIFQVLRILKARRPRAFILENVKGLLTAEQGQSFRTIQDAFRAAGYSFHWKVIQGTDCGIPQRRPRLFMVGFRDENPDFGNFSFPEPVGKLKYTMSDVFGGKCEKDVGYTATTADNNQTIDSKYNWMRYWVDGKDREVGILEIQRMMNFPDDFIFVDGTSRTQKMKQLGNAVIPSVVKSVAESVIKHLQNIN